MLLAGMINRLSGPGTAFAFTANSRSFDRSARALVATAQKVGVGFDYTELDALILAGDVQNYFMQVLGRVFRRSDARPLVFDLVDNHASLRRHLTERKRVYRGAGGSVRKVSAAEAVQK